MAKSEDNPTIWVETIYDPIGTVDDLFGQAIVHPRGRGERNGEEHQPDQSVEPLHEKLKDKC